MLETEEVDDEFFTPVAGTSLANIFGNELNIEQSTQNNSLKYVPPKPQNIEPKKKETKVTECIFACALIGLEWCNNVYTSKGKLGFAILKNQKTGGHDIVLYDSNKTILSSTTITENLDISIKNDSYISYYDSVQKYWSIYGTEKDTQKIAEVLRDCGANVNYSTFTVTENNQELPGPKFETETNVTLKGSDQQHIESDTDSSVNRKTKASILNRMANMGHSVLPIRALPAERSSDSSDTNKNETTQKVVRHKTFKTSIKRNSTENIVSEHQNLPEPHQKITATRREPENNVALYSGQLMPLTTTGVVASTSNELGMFMTEQRINNSELRININRITDKMDSVLNKIDILEHKEKDTNISTDILSKLLNEYESKIKIYEELLGSRGMANKTVIEDRLKYLNQDNEVELLKYKISEIEKENKDKSYEIFNLQKDIKLLEDKQFRENQNQVSKENELLSKINSLVNDLEMKNKEIIDLKNNVSVNTKIDNDNTEEKVKNIMNNMFQTISMNFENDNNYSGETIKRIIGTVIKKITIETLSEL